MTEISRVALFGKLNPITYRAIESATTFCKLRGNPYVELVHWIRQILEGQDSDLHHLVRHFELEPSRLAADITQALDKLPRGATAISDFSPHIEEALERGWVFATLMFGEAQVRSGHLILAAVKTASLRNVLFGISRQFERIKAEALSDEFGKILGGSPEAALAASDGSKLGTGAEGGPGMAPAAMGKQEALKQFSIDLTERARNGEIDPIVGRDLEIRQIVDILMRRRQNNPILTGEAGVGKTAVVEGFALAIAEGDVPPMLKDVSLRMLDVGLLQAGASMRGEFESRLRAVIDEVQSSPKPIILFIDEAHTLIGAGGAAGTGDAANLLKPALARGTLRTIAATTWSEYKKYFEKDPALTRRFQVVQVQEPGEEKAILMMRGIATPLEKHHRVQILDEAIEAAVRLSHRYIPARQLPDKSLSLLDTAAARVAISQHAVPPEVEASRRHIQALNTELEIIGRELAIGMDAAERENSAKVALEREQAELAELEQRWNREKELVDKVLELRAVLRDGHAAVDQPEPGQPADRAAVLQELRSLQAELTEFQGESPLILPSVDEQAVASVVSDWTSIPVRRMVKNEVQAVLQLGDTLGRRVIGQDHALQMIAKRVQTSRAGLDNPSKPIGVFMLCGPSGVGKTETALALAESLYGGEQNLITINMSEFQEAHTVSTLKGAPPGYVGYGEGGVLTEAVRRRPYSVVLLDEVEKAHPDVHEIFFQVFDKGMMEDGEGRLINFKNTMILLTSNVGTEIIMSLCRDPELIPAPDEIAKALREPLLKVFPPALLGRLITIPYYPLSDKVMGDIIRLQLGRIATRIGEQHKVPFTYDEAVVQLIASRCTEPESGGRMIDAILTNTLLPAISAAFLERLLEGGQVARVHVGVQDSEFSYAFD
ncbi:MAG: type VI secretion system ATPase TssH [Alphaproteobacteria bacterium]|nr:type VI secretion system ATPase TssH [Alphaproteobacteria bacterium]